MPILFNEEKYPGIKQWISDNPQDKSLPEAIKQDLLRFKDLTEPEKKALQAALFAILKLPDVIVQFIPDHLGALPNEVLLEIEGNLRNESDRSSLMSTSRKMHALFQPNLQTYTKVM